MNQRERNRVAEIEYLESKAFDLRRQADNLIKQAERVEEYARRSRLFMRTNENIKNRRNHD